MRSECGGAFGGLIGKEPARSKLELWGGLECTVNRVGDKWFDQTPRSGHEDRISDLELFAGLGITSLRYPALWERISPNAADERDFRWTDERLPRIRDLGMNPIVTLCHHGSGPHWTNLLDDSFAPGLAKHAAAVAERYPWITDWTPVNEPLTTARFSAMYGYWYPHTHTEEAMWIALLNEIDATRLSMREIRKVNPQARLIQTDDLGYCHATEPLQAEADFQNQRRWIGWDLLCGMVTPGHPLWPRLAEMGLGDRLRAIAEDPCPPDVIGVNHYLASERLLDHRIERHGLRAIADRDTGKCGGVEYVDVDAIRSLEEGVLGLPALLKQAWERYGRPVAVTECHNGASRDEQARWFVEVWRGCETLRAEGVNIPAVTAWSLLGSHDWNRMVTRFIGHYEPGVFDIRSGEPRPTMLAGVLRELAAGREPTGVGLDEAGWWRRPWRFLNAPAPGMNGFDVSRRPDSATAPPLMLVGEGALADLLARACDVRSLRYVRRGDVTERALAAVAPWAVVDARDWAQVCEGAVSPAFAPPEALVELCGRLGVRCAVFSAPDLFDEVDERLLSLAPDHLLLARTQQVFTPWDRSHYAVLALEALEAGLPLEAEEGFAWDACYGPDVIDGVLDLLMDGETGVRLFTAPEPWSAADFLVHLAHTADCGSELVRRTGGRDPDRPAPPRSFLPPGETTLERFVCEARRARSRDLAGMTRRRDEPHMQAAE